MCKDYFESKLKHGNAAPEDLKFGADRYVYCKSHLRVHSTGWCTVPIRDKILMDSLDFHEAVAEADRKEYRYDKFF